MSSLLLSRDLLDQYKEGKRTFENVIIQFADLQGSTLPDICIKDSKLFFVTFFNSNLSGAKFINCEIFFGSFYGCRLGNAIFDKCRIELTLFDQAIFNRTKITKSEISYSGLFNTNLKDLDMSSSTQFKVFTDPSQITDHDIESGLSILMPHLDKLDTQIKSKIKKMLEWDAQTYKFSVPSMVGSPTNYKKEGTYAGNNTSSYIRNASAYSGQMGDILHEVISSYSNLHPKRKSSYMHDSKYK